ncbi:MAG: hypothetical protein AAF125_16485 [Chloroflexota bacterium]
MIRRAVGLWGVLLALIGSALALGAHVPSSGLVTYEVLGVGSVNVALDVDRVLRVPLRTSQYAGGMWSPSGRYRLYTRRDEDLETFDLLLTDPIGLNDIHIQLPPPLDDDGNLIQVFSSRFNFSSDERHLIYFMSVRQTGTDGTVGDFQTYVGVADFAGEPAFGWGLRSPLEAGYAWSPGGRYLAEVSSGLIGPDGNLMTPIWLTVGDTTIDDAWQKTIDIPGAVGVDARSGAWSGDEMWLALTGIDAPNRSPELLYIVSKDGEDIRLVGDTRNRPMRYTWATNGAQLALTIEDGLMAVYDATTETEVRRLSAGPETLLTPVVWSPDSEVLLAQWLAMDDAPASRNHLVLVIKDELSTIGIFNGGVRNVMWSPNGTQALLTITDRGQADIYLLDLPSRSLRPLTDQGLRNHSPRWSLDGTQVVFASDRAIDTNEAIFMMNADGTDVQRLNRVGQGACCVRWLPLGR